MSDQPNEPTTPQWAPPPGPPQPPVGPDVPDYLIWSILATLFCCQPLGIAGIVYAAMANSKKGSADFAGAMKDAAMAKKLLWWSFGLGLVVIVGVILFYVVMAVVGFAATETTTTYDSYNY